MFGKYYNEEISFLREEISRTAVTNSRRNIMYISKLLYKMICNTHIVSLMFVPCILDVVEKTNNMH
jgi:hypothetical protein